MKHCCLQRVASRDVQCRYLVPGQFLNIVESEEQTERHHEHLAFMQELKAQLKSIPVTSKNRLGRESKAGGNTNVPVHDANARLNVAAVEVGTVGCTRAKGGDPDGRAYSCDSRLAWTLSCIRSTWHKSLVPHRKPAAVDSGLATALLPQRRVGWATCYHGHCPRKSRWRGPRSR